MLATVAPMETAPQLTELEGGLWGAWHFYGVGTDDYLSMVSALVPPLVSELRALSLVDRFFFIRYIDEEGHHIRLRLRFPEAGCADQAESLIRDRAAELGLNATPQQFEPEVERYGGPQHLPLSLEFFCLSSRVALAWIQGHAEQPRSKQLPALMGLLTRQAVSLARNLDELSLLLDYFAGWREKLEAPAQHGDLVFESQSEGLTTMLRLHIEAALSAEIPAEDLIEAARTLSSATAELDSKARNEILKSQMHMTANRLGLRNTEEVYVTQILRRALSQLVDADPGYARNLEGRLARQHAGAVPFIVRVAGLPASVALAFRSGRCREEMEEIHRLALELATLRTEATDKLFAAVPEVPPELRRNLIGIKRDCFNGRDIRHRAPESLEGLRPWVGDVLARVVALEERLDQLQKGFEETYAEARDDVRELLLRQGENRELRRGLTLASRDLAENYRRLGKKSYLQFGRKERGAERSLARYITRAAVKLSPYSTLTRLGLGAAVPLEIPGLHLLAQPWEERSLVRLKSYLPNQWEALLLRIPQIREELRLALNDTLEDLGEGQHRLLRPLMLQWNEEKQDFEFVRAAQVKVRLGGPLVAWLKERLSGGPAVYGTLCAQAAGDFGSNREDVASLFERFVDIGLLKLLPPWPTYESYPERRILEFLETSPAAAFAALDPVRELLRCLVEAQQGYATAESPAAAIAEIESLAPEIFVAIKRVLSPSSELNMEKGRQDIYEDVLLHLPADGKASVGGEIARISRATADELFDAGNSLWRLRGLFERRHECLHAFWHVARERWPAGTRVPCLRFFAEMEETWKLYVEHLVSGEGLFNPYDLAAVRELGDLRASVVDEIVRTLEAREDGYHVSLPDLRRLLACIPSACQAPVGACLIVQPADAEGDLWVAHRLGDGSGRYSSRFSTLMHEPLRDWFTGHFTERSRVTAEGEPAELLDLLFTQLTTVNRHWPQTHKVLETPGETSDLPAHRVMRPSDLWIEIGENSGELRMRDREGRRYLPCFLSALHTAWIPTFIKFLSVFGIDSRGRLDITAPVELQGKIERHPRLTVGRLVFRRGRWVVPVGEIPRATGNEAADFAAVWSWRRAVGLPERIFWIEPLRPKVEGLPLFKPQYIDFNSPTLVALLLDGLAERPADEATTFEEALPTPDAFPKDASGEGWGTELLLEGVAFQPASQSFQVLSHHNGEASTEGNLNNLEGVLT